MFQVVARFTEPAQTVSGDAARDDHRAGNDDFSQAGDLFRLMTPNQQARLCDNIAAAMTGVPEAIARRQIGPFPSADRRYGEGVAKRLGVTVDDRSAAE